MKCLRLLVWLLITTLSVSASRMDHFCGKSPYYLDEQICCDSKLSNLTQDGQIVQCCTTSGKIYKPGSELCCGDVYNRQEFKKQNFSCCNGKPIERTREICCGGNIISREEGRGCCGNISFNLRRGRCCLDKLHHRKHFKGRCCGSETYDNRTHYCQVTNSFTQVLPIYLQRCGTEIINTRTHICCYEDTPVDITTYRGEYPPVCCSNSVIPDKNKFHCYLDRILLRNQSLCRKETDSGETYQVYFHTDQWCCNGNVIKKNSTSGRKETCCGSEVIDSSTHRCCAGKHPYIDLKHCCGDIVVSSKEMCCGTAVLTAEQVCCNETNKIFPVQKQSEFDDSCCNGKPYRRAAETCSRDDETPKCGQQRFNTSEDKCCNNKLFKGGNRPDIKCCGAYFLNITYQECIFGRPHNITVKNPTASNRKLHLCGKMNIRVRKRKDKCCLNKFHKNAKSNGLRCCGADVFDKRNQKCCFGRPVPLNSDSCNRRNRRHHSERSPPLRCSSQDWIRTKVLKKMECIQHAYIMEKESHGHNYRTKKDLKKRKGRKRTWNAAPFCSHVSRHRRFIFVTNPSGNYTLKYTKKYSNKIRKLIKRIPLCKFS